MTKSSELSERILKNMDKKSELFNKEMEKVRREYIIKSAKSRKTAAEIILNS